MLEPTTVHIWTIVSAVFIVFLYLKLSSSSPLRQSSLGMQDDSTQGWRLNATFHDWNSSTDAQVQENADSALAQLVQPYDVFLVLDVEGTCEQGSSFDYPNEIIVRVYRDFCFNELFLSIVDLKGIPCVPHEMEGQAKTWTGSHWWIPQFCTTFLEANSHQVLRRAYRNNSGH